jgi:GntR family transcriptional regulator
MVIHFRLDPRLGTPTYLQLAQQVRRALIQGVLSPGDRLPTAREVVNALTINPNTVLKAYAELERDGLVISRPGLGTFITDAAPAPIAGAVQRRLRPGLDAWLAKARAAGLNDEAIAALFALAVDDARRAGVA